MDNYCKITFKDKTYTISSIVDFKSEHSKETDIKNIYYISTEEIPHGLIHDVSSKYPITAIVLGEEIWRPSIKMKTFLNQETKKIQYEIIISDKGDSK